jgi:hypothetical protein
MYTIFPNLLSKDLGEDKLEDSSQQLFDLQGSEEQLLRAWATILSGYTGRDDQVSFACDEGVVEVSLGDGNLRKQRRESDDVPRDSTAIFFKPVGNTSKPFFKC